jgi:hypothetical protein
MHPSAPDIRDAIESYVRLLESPPSSEQVDLELLADAIDRLVFVGRHSPDVSADDQPDPPDTDYDRYRALASKRFPSLGHYNRAGYATRSIGDMECVVGDAIDDLADIACDLTSVLWCFDNTTDLDALWHFRFSYENHWGKHAADLRWYLHAVARDY